MCVFLEPVSCNEKLKRCESWARLSIPVMVVCNECIIILDLVLTLLPLLKSQAAHSHEHLQSSDCLIYTHPTVAVLIFFPCSLLKSPYHTSVFSSMGDKVYYQSDQPRKLSYQLLENITNDFDEAQIVGHGAYGTVYKGTCENGEEIAVKVLKNMTGFDNKEFEKEFENLKRLKHQNVVELLGFCNESEEVVAEYDGKPVVADKMHTALCFEFVRNGSLAEHISADGCSGLNWPILYNIIKGICQGLEYLRHGLENPVWHLDLKPANILLDNNMIPKLADFGLSRLLGDESTINTISPVGTRRMMVGGKRGSWTLLGSRTHTIQGLVTTKSMSMSLERMWMRTTATSCPSKRRKRRRSGPREMITTTKARPTLGASPTAPPSQSQSPAASFTF